MPSSTRTLTRIFLGLALAAAGVQAIALMIDADTTTGGGGAGGWDGAAAARLGAADLWSQVGALLNGPGGRMLSVQAAPNIWDTTSAFITAAPRQLAVAMTQPSAIGTLEVALEPPAPIVPAANFAPPLLAQQTTPFAAVSPPPAPTDNTGIVLGDDSSPTPAPVPAPAAFWLFAAVLPLLRPARRK